ncbi:heterokaryon incompatibility protein-domain-containing protein [Apiospora hydei]|uniref:Heterokaryon incompatibility protein-domain-containing protein n=1 Tax=Apiospora hydei TaxID=1337664 RepID=A0ABR1W0C5_9PEZI
MGGRQQELMFLGKSIQQWAKGTARNLPFLFTCMCQAMKLQAGSQYQIRREVLPDLFYYVEHDMRLMATTTGHIGWAHVRARAKDSIFILKGSTVPVILRPRPEGGFVLVGDAFVCGMMSGEAMKPDEDPLWTEIQIH